MTLEATLDAQELGLTLPIPLVDHTALGTGLTRVPRINQLKPDSKKPCFVSQERPELKERPASVPCSLRVPNSYPIMDTLEVFKSNSSSGVFGLEHDPLSDPMVLDATKSGLLARDFLEPMFCALGSTRLKSLSVPSVPLSDSSLRLASGIASGIASGGYSETAGWGRESRSG